jgi:hypothetical protein
MSGTVNGIYTGANQGIFDGDNTGISNGVSLGLQVENILTNAIVRNGLVLHLDASQNLSYAGSGTIWKDISGNNNNGTLINNPTFNSLNGGSIVFDGSDDYVIATDTLLPMGTTHRTNQFYFFARNSAIGELVTYGTPGNKSGASNNQMNAILWLNNRVYFSAYSNTYNVFSSILSTNQWYNVAVVYNGVSNLIYINGSLNATGPVGFSTISDGTLTIGCRRDGNSFFVEFFNGRIPIVKIYNRALSQSEVLQNFNATKARFGL